jgi:hypothetical protein
MDWMVLSRFHGEFVIQPFEIPSLIGFGSLSELWSRPNWLAWFFFVTFFIFFTYEVTHLLNLLLKSRESLSPAGGAEFDASLPPMTSGGRSRNGGTNPVIKAVKTVWAKWRGVREMVLARMERVFERTDDARLRYMQGIGWAVVGGSLAGGCLVFTKAM